jgi:hypothetical protein
LMVH